MTYKQLSDLLLPTYGEREAKSIARLVMERRFGLSLADICMGKDTELSANDGKELEKIAHRLLTGEPVQYVLGSEWWRGREYAVGPSVLIPRPETEQLVTLALACDAAQRPHPAVLDIGTGSGCIAVSMALELPGSQVEAWDVSSQALSVAQANAKRLGAEVRFRLQDALCAPCDERAWDIIVSNPPYVCDSEKAQMHPNVLQHEPWTALFVADADPLLFYRHIANYAARALNCGGSLLFETNTRFAHDVQALMQQLGFGGVATHDDCFGMPRFVWATKTESGDGTHHDTNKLTS